MRKSKSAAPVARAVAVLFAAPVIAHAALATHSFGTSSSSSTGPSVTTASMPVASSAPSTPAAGSSGSSGSTASNTIIAPTHTTQADQRAAATDQAVQPQRSSANTSASQLRAAAASSTPGTGTSGGSSTGTTGGGTTGTVVTGSSLGFPGSVGVIVNSGEPAVDVNGNIVGSNAMYAVAPAVTQVATPAPLYAGAELAFADSTMNQVIGEAKRDRHRVGRNGQLLYSIAPRTNVDRSREVPDDGPSPALTGPLSR